MLTKLIKVLCYYSYKKGAVPFQSNLRLSGDPRGFGSKFFLFPSVILTKGWPGEWVTDLEYTLGAVF